MNLGWQRNEGIDFQGSYDWEWEGLGAFNAGIVGTYYLNQESQVPGAPIDDFYHTDFAPVNGVEQLGVESRPRFKYRARLGWSDGDLEPHRLHELREPLLPHASLLLPMSILAASSLAELLAGCRPTRTHA